MSDVLSLDHSISKAVKYNMVSINISVSQSALSKALSHIQTVVEKRNTIPILSNVKLSAKDDYLELTATDMDIAISEKIPAIVLEVGVITISAHTLYDIVRKLSDNDQISMSINENNRGKLSLNAGHSNFQLSYLEASDFPVMDQGELPHQFMLPAAILKNMIEKNRLTISTEETRYNLNGMYMHQTTQDGKQVLKTAATDGHRLSCCYCELPSGAENIPGIIIPRKAITELKKILEGVEGQIVISLSENKIRFAIDDIVFVSKLIDGNFPDYEGLIPKNNDLTMTVAKNIFTKAVDRVTSINLEKSRAVKFIANGDKLQLIATADDQSKAEELLDISSNCIQLEVGFNSRYLFDIMSSISGDEIQFSFADSLSPTVIKDITDDFSCFVVMPMRV